MDKETKDQLEAFKEEQAKAKQQSCPNCGYCPHCGRGGAWLAPYRPWQPYYPYTIAYTSAASGYVGGTAPTLSSTQFNTLG